MIRRIVLLFTILFVFRGNLIISNNKDNYVVKYQVRVSGGDNKLCTGTAPRFGDATITFDRKQYKIDNNNGCTYLFVPETKKSELINLYVFVAYGDNDLNYSRDFKIENIGKQPEIAKSKDSGCPGLGKEWRTVYINWEVDDPIRITGINHDIKHDNKNNYYSEYDNLIIYFNDFYENNVDGRKIEFYTGDYDKTSQKVTFTDKDIKPNGQLNFYYQDLVGTTDETSSKYYTWFNKEIKVRIYKKMINRKYVYTEYNTGFRYFPRGARFSLNNIKRTACDNSMEFKVNIEEPDRIKNLSNINGINNLKFEWNFYIGGAVLYPCTLVPDEGSKYKISFSVDDENAYNEALNEASYLKLSYQPKLNGQEIKYLSVFNKIEQQVVLPSAPGSITITQSKGNYGYDSNGDGEKDVLFDVPVNKGFVLLGAINDNHNRLPYKIYSKENDNLHLVKIKSLKLKELPQSEIILFNTKFNNDIKVSVKSAANKSDYASIYLEYYTREFNKLFYNSEDPPGFDSWYIEELKKRSDYNNCSNSFDKCQSDYNQDMLDCSNRAQKKANLFKLAFSECEKEIANGGTMCSCIRWKMMGENETVLNSICATNHFNYDYALRVITEKCQGDLVGCDSEYNQMISCRGDIKARHKKNYRDIYTGSNKEYTTQKNIFLNSKWALYPGGAIDYVGNGSNLKIYDEYYNRKLRDKEMKLLAYRVDGLGNLIDGRDHTMILKDSDGCPHEFTINVKAPDPITFSNSFENKTTTCMSSDGEVVLNILGGIPPFSYSPSLSDFKKNVASKGSDGRYTISGVQNSFYVYDSNFENGDKYSGGIKQYNIDDNVDVSVSDPIHAISENGKGSFTVSVSGLSSYNFIYKRTDETAYHNSPSNNYSLSIGKYNVGVESNGCYYFSEDVEIKDHSLKMKIQSENRVLKCDYGSDGSIQVDLEHTIGNTKLTLSGPVNVNMDIPGSNHTFTGLPEGEYTITADNGHCVINSEAITIKRPNKVEFEIKDEIDEINFGDGDAKLDIKVTKGNSYIRSVSPSFVLKEGFTDIYTKDFSANGSTSRTQLVTVTWDGGCSYSKNVNINGPKSVLTATKSSTNSTCVSVFDEGEDLNKANSSNGSVSVTPSGGWAPYTVKISGKEATNNKGVYTLNGLEAEEHEIQVIDSKGAVYNTSKTVGFESDFTITDAIPVSPSCNTLNTGTTNDGTITAKLEGTHTSPYKISTTGKFEGEEKSNLTKTGLNAKIGYSVYVKDKNGCIAKYNGTVTLEERDVISLNGDAEIDNTNCTEGYIKVDISGGHLNGDNGYSFDWGVNNAKIENTKSSSTIKELGTGNYSVQVTDDNSCTQEFKNLIIEPIDKPDILKVEGVGGSSDAVCFGNEDGVLKVKGKHSSGSKDFIFKYRENEQSGEFAEFIGLGEGSHSVEISYKGCESIEPFNIGVQSEKIEIPIAKTVIEFPSCNKNNSGIHNDGIIYVPTPTGGFGDAKWTYSKSGSKDSFGDSNELTGFNAGTHTIYVKDSKDCKASTPVVVGERSELKYSSVVDVDNGCSEYKSVKVNVTGGYEDKTFKWTKGVDESVTEIITNTANSTTLQNKPGTYYLEVKDDKQCIINSKKTVTIKSTEKPNISFNESTDIEHVKCYGASTGKINVRHGSCGIAFSTSSGDSFNGYNFKCVSTDGKGYSEERKGVNVQFDKLPAGDFKITITDKEGKSNYVTATVTQKPVITIPTPTITKPSCHINNAGTLNDGTVRIPTPSGGRGSGWQYAKADKNYSTNSLLKNFTKGTHTIYVKDGFGCEASKSVTIGERTELKYTTTTFPAEGCNEYNSVKVNVTGGDGGNVYKWTTSSDVAVTKVITNTVNSSTLQNIPGTYNIEVNDKLGCKIKGEKTVTIKPTEKPTISFDKSSDIVHVKCNGAETGIINVRHGSCGIAFRISSGDSFNGYKFNCVSTDGKGYSKERKGFNVQFDELPAGDFKITITDKEGKSNYVNATVTQKQVITIPTPTITKPSCHTNNAGTLNDGTVQIPTPSGGSGSGWQYAKTDKRFSTSDLLEEFTKGTHTIYVKDGFGCEASKSVTIGERSELKYTTTTFPAEACNEYKSVKVNVTGGDGGNVYKWFNSSDVAVTKVITNTTNSTTLQNEPGSYSVEVADNKGCKIIDKKTVTISETESPRITFDASSDIKHVNCNGESTGIINVRHGSCGIAFSISVGDSFNGYIFKCESTDGKGYSEERKGVDVQFDKLHAGDFKITITDKEGKSNYVNATVTQKPVITIPTPTITKPSCHTNNAGTLNDGTVQIPTPSGGSGSGWQYAKSDKNYSTNNLLKKFTKGAHTIYVKDGLGCKASKSVTIGQRPELEFTTTSFPTEGCGEYKSVKVNVTGGSGSNVFKWFNSSDAAVTKVITNTTNTTKLKNRPGAYNIEVSDKFGCKIKDKKIVTIPTTEEPEISFNASTDIEHVKCNGAKTGIINVRHGSCGIAFSRASGDSFDGYRFKCVSTDGKGYSEIKTGVNVQFDKLPAGNFKITITDKEGKIDFVTATVDEPNKLVIESFPNGTPTCHSDNNVTDESKHETFIKAYVTGGVWPYKISVNENAFTDDQDGRDGKNNVSQGGFKVGSNYRVQIKDENGCLSAVKATSITNPDNKVGFIMDAPVQPHCTDKGSIVVDITNGKSPYTYKWKKNNVDFDNKDDKNSSNVVVSDYSGVFKLNVTDGNGCIIEDDISATLVKAEKPTLTHLSTKPVTCQTDDATDFYAGLSGNNKLDSDGAIVVTATKGLPLKAGQELIFEYSKHGEDNWKIVNDVENGNKATIKYLPVGDYDIRVTYNNCTTTLLKQNVGYKNSEVSIPEIPLANITSPTCHTQNEGVKNDGKVIVPTPQGDVGNWNYSKDNISYTPSNTLTEFKVGNHTIYTVDNDGCKAKQNFVINEPVQIEIPEDNISQTHTKCVLENGEIEFKSSGADNYLLLDSGTDTKKIFEKESGKIYFKGVAPSDNYIIKATNNEGVCSQQSVQVKVNGSTLPTVVLEGNITNTLCWGEGFGSATGEFSVNGIKPIPDFGEEFTFSLIKVGDTGFDNQEQTGTQALFQNLPYGDYKVKVVYYGCENIIGGFNVGYKSSELRKGDLTFNPPTCHTNEIGEQNDGEIVVNNVSGGVGSYKYKIEGQSFNSENILKGLNTKPEYTVVIKDEDGCMVRHTGVKVPEPSEFLTLTAKPETTRCGFDNGRIEVQPAGAERFNYELRNSSGSANVDVIDEDGKTYLSNLASDNSYEIKLYDKAKTCYIVKSSIDVAASTSPELKEETAKRENVKCFGDFTGEIVVSHTTGGISNGDGNYKFVCKKVGDSDWTDVIKLGKSDVVFDKLPIGKYIISIYDFSGNQCTNSLPEIEITQPDKLLILSATSTIVKTKGESTASVDIKISGGVVKYDYALKGVNGNNFGVENISGPGYNFENMLPADNYTLTVTDGFGCIAQKSDIIVEEPEKAIAVAVQLLQKPNCHHLSSRGKTDNGIFELTITEGWKSPYSVEVKSTSGSDYLVNREGVTDKSLFKGLTGGETYNIKVVDSKGGLHTMTYLVPEPEQLKKIEVLSHRTKCNDSNGSISIKVEGGTGNYTYWWKKGLQKTYTTSAANYTTPQNLEAGDYTVDVSDDNGCRLPITEIINVQQSYPISYVSESEPVSCNSGSDGTITINITKANYTGDYIYTLKKDGVTEKEVISNKSSNTFIDKPKGTYTVEVSDSDKCKFTSANPIVVSEPDALVFEVTTSRVKAKSSSTGSISVNVTGGNSGEFTYKLFDKNQSELKEETSSDRTLIFGELPAGNYYIKVTDSKGCEKLSELINIVEPETALSFTATVTDGLCLPKVGKVVLQGVGGWGDYEFKHMGQGFQKSPVFDQLSAGKYQFSVMDAEGVVYTAEVVVNLPEKEMTASVKNTQIPKCSTSDDGAVSLEISGGLSPYYVSVDSKNYIEGTVVSGISGGENIIYLKDKNDCRFVLEHKVESNDAVVVENPVIVATPCGKSEGSVNVTAKGGVGGYTYEWKNSSGAVIGNNALLESLPYGIYNLSVTDANDCEFTEVYAVENAGGINVTEISKHNITGYGKSDGSIELNIPVKSSPLEFIVNSPNSETTYSDTDNSDEFSYSDGVLTLSDLNQGWHIVRVNAPGECSGVYKFNIAEPGELKVDFNVTNDKTKNASEGRVVATISGGVGEFIYKWINENNPTQVITPVNTETTSVVDGLNKGNYRITVTDKNGNSITKSVDVEEPEFDLNIPKPHVEDPKCFNSADGLISVSSTGGWGDYMYKLDRLIMSSDGSSVVNTVQVEYYKVTSVFHNLIKGRYNITVKDRLGAEVNSIVELSQPEQLAVVVQPNKIIHVGCYGDNTGSISPDITGGTKPYKYSTNGVDFDKDDGILKNLNSGDYTFYITDENGCTADKIINEIISQPAAPLTIDKFEVTNTTCGLENGSVVAEISGGTEGVDGYTYEWRVKGVDKIIETKSTIAGLKGAVDYTFSVRDANGCYTSREFTVQSSQSPVITDVEFDDVLCYGGDIEPAKVVFTEASPVTPYEIIWSNGDKGEYSSRLSEGEYSVKIQDANGCESNLYSFTVSQPEKPLKIELKNIKNTDCYDNANGSIINIEVTGGSGGYSYKWSNGAVMEDLNDVDKGKYSVEVTDINRCKISASYDIDEPELLTYSVTSVKQVTCNNDADGEIVLDANGASGNYYYSFNNTDWKSGLKIPVEKGGEYTLYLKDENNCRPNEYIKQSVYEPERLLISDADVTHTTCDLANGAIKTTISGGNGGNVYEWKNSADAHVSSESNIDRLLPETYTLKVEDSKGCNAEVTKTVNSSSIPTVTSFEQTDVNCFGESTGSVKLTVEKGIKPYDVSWSNGVEGVDNLNLSKGKYSVTITDAKGCSSTEEYDITENDLLEYSIIKTSDVTCNGSKDGELKLDIKGGTKPYKYSSDNKSWNAIKDISGLSGGYYHLYVKDANECKPNEELAMFVNEPSVLDIKSESTDHSSCGLNNGELIVSLKGGNGNYSYEWKNLAGDVIKNSSRVDGLAPGIYKFHGEDSKGCNIEKSYNINPSTLPRINSLNVTDVLCNGQNTGSAAIRVTHGVEPYDISWSNGQKGVDANKLTAGRYSVEVKDDDGCSIVREFEVSENSLVKVELTDNSPVTCNNDSDGELKFKAEGGVAPYYYSLDNTNWVESLEIPNLSGGDYTVHFKDKNNCSPVAPIKTSIYEPLKLEITNTDVVQTTCNIDNGSIEVNVTGGNSEYKYNWTNSDGDIDNSSNSLENLPPNTYSLTVSDKKGCSTDITRTINSSTIPEITSFNKSDVLCFGDNSGSARVSVEKGIKPYTIEWSDGQSGINASNLVKGDYTVKVTDAKGCKTDKSFEITQPEQLEFAIAEKDSVTCFNDGDASIKLSASGGTLPYSYSLDNNTWVESLDIPNLSGGDYTVYFKDKNKCSPVAQIKTSIYEPSKLEITNTDVVQTTCNIDNGSIEVNVTGGNSEYKYSWKNSDADIDNKSNSLENLAPNTYSLKVTDKKGCFVDITRTIKSSTIPEITSFSKSDVECFGNNSGFAQIFVEKGVKPYTIEWSDGQTGLNASNLVKGDYSVEVTDAKGCKTDKRFEITQPDQLVFSIAKKDSVTCFNDGNASIKLAASGGTLPYSYSLDNNTWVESLDIPNLSGGDYTIYFKDKNNCSPVAPIKTSVYEPTKLEITNTDVVQTTCNIDNGSIEVNVTGGNSDYKYSWKNSDGEIENDSNSLESLSPDTYSLKITDKKGCFVEQSTTINPSTIPEITSFSKSDVVCFGDNSGSARVSIEKGITPYTIEWSDGQSGLSASDLVKGDYSVKVTDAKGCKTDRNFEITQPEQLVFSIAEKDSVTCFNDGDAAIKLSASGGTLPYSYSLDYNTWVESLDIPNLSGGDYTVYFKDKNNCSPDAPIKTSIYEPSKLEITNTDFVQTTCNIDNGSIEVNVTGGNSEYHYNWRNSDGDIENNSNSLDNLSPNIYSLKVTDKKGCFVDITRTIKSSTIPEITSFSKSNVVCFGDNTGSARVSVEQGITPYTIEWSDGQSGLSASNLVKGDYSVKVTDAKGCKTDRNFEIIQPEQLVFSIAEKDSVTCFNDGDASIKLSASGGTLPYSYSLDNNTWVESLDIPNLSGGDYTVYFKDKNNCSPVAPIKTSIYEPSKLEITNIGVVQTTCNIDNGSIEVNVTGGNSDYKYDWRISDGDIDNDSNSLENLSPNTYSLTITDKKGCSTGISRTINPSTIPEITSFSKSNVVCFGGNSGSARVSVEKGITPYTIEWSNGKTGVYVSKLAKGDYNVNVTDAKGCKTDKSFEITQPDKLLFSIAEKDSVTCFNDGDASIKLSASGGDGDYEYSLDNKSWFKGLELNHKPGGDYTIYLKDGNNCTAESPISTSIYEPEELKIIDTTVVHTTCDRENGSIQIEAAGGNGLYQYYWSTRDGKVDNNSSIIENLPHKYYSVKVTDKKGCKVQAIDIEVNPSGIPLIMENTVNDVLCFGGNTGSVELDVKYGVKPYDIKWSNGGTGLKQESLSKGNYSVEVTDSKGCKSKGEYRVDEPEKLEIEYTSIVDSKCYGYENGSIQLSVKGGKGDYIYSWSNGKSDSKVSDLAEGDYSVVVTDNNKCTVSGNYSITEPEEIVVNLGDDINVCAGQEYTLDAGKFHSYEWSSDNGFTSNNRYVTIKEDGDYFLTVKDEIGCFDKDTVNFTTSNDLLDAEFIVPTDVNTGDTIMLIDISNMPPDSIRWEFDDYAFKAVDTSKYDISLEVLKNGIYNVTMFAYKGECYSFNTKQIQIEVADDDDSDEDSFFGVSEPMIKEFKVYPVPNNGKFYIDIDLKEQNDIELRLYGINSSREIDIQDSEGSNEYRLEYDFTRLPKGVYLLILEVAGERKRKKIIIR